MTRLNVRVNFRAQTGKNNLCHMEGDQGTTESKIRGKRTDTLLTALIRCPYVTLGPVRMGERDGRLFEV